MHDFMQYFWQVIVTFCVYYHVYTTTTFFYIYLRRRLLSIAIDSLVCSGVAFESFLLAQVREYRTHQAYQFLFSVYSQF